MRYLERSSSQKQSRKVTVRVWEEGDLCLMGTEFQFGKMKEL